MKKPTVSLLLALTLAFCGFCLGLFLDRRDAVTTSVPQILQTIPTVAAEDTSLCYPLDINTATAQELMTLPGIGEDLAWRIVSYREEHGPFPEVQALLNVEGIGEQRLKDIFYLVCAE